MVLRDLFGTSIHGIDHTVSPIVFGSTQHCLFLARQSVATCFWPGKALLLVARQIKSTHAFTCKHFATLFLIYSRHFAGFAGFVCFSFYWIFYCFDSSTGDYVLQKLIPARRDFCICHEAFLLHTNFAWPQFGRSCESTS